MKRDIVFFKNVGLANALLETKKCKNEGNFILKCEDNIEDMKILQKACSEYLKDTEYKDYKLCFVNSSNYKDMITNI